MRNKIYIGMLLVVILLAACGNRDELMQSVLRFTASESRPFLGGQYVPAPHL